MSGNPYRILIIEDSVEDRVFYRRHIAKGHEENYSFFETASAEEGLRLCRELTPDCVLLDYQLPDMDGLEFLDRLSIIVRQATIPIIMLTGRGNEEVAVQAMKKGIHDYLVKGLNTNGLRQVVHSAIDQGVLRRQIASQRQELERMAEERLSLIAELKLHTAALSDANIRKDEFLAMLAHELRNPLAAISNAANVLTITDHKEEIDHSNHVIRRQTKHLSRLIEDLLDVSRISLGKIELRQTVIDITAILDSAVEAIKVLTDERNHTLHLTLDRGNLWVNADPTRVEQIIVNLLNNAAKYTDTGGQIWLTARREESDLFISVKDSGVGIPHEKLPAMFELFTQGDRSSARTEGGLGIGLTIVKKLVEMHGGSIAAVSDGPGMGSEFMIRMPAVEPTAPATAPLLETQTSGRKASILVIDDNIDTARSMATLLKLSGHEVLTAHCGTEALKIALSHRPSVILLDIGLPGMDGYEIARRLRLVESCTDAVIIATSGYGQQEDRRRTKEAGFDHHLVKPIDFSELIATIESALEKP
jgi:signal transduction histidine kinase